MGLLGLPLFVGYSHSLSENIPCNSDFLLVEYLKNKKL